MEASFAPDAISRIPDHAATRGVTPVGVGDLTSTVFVIDDGISVRESLELLIRTAGWEPETFVSAEEFLSHPRGSAPCCLVLDLTLPGLPGLVTMATRLGLRPGARH
jgi:ActR/RegA family two-component response regulator